ncbi:TlpA family protein disulfide reductase [Bizionia myxarmorum]|uniref:TlpA family protein disulfide reductase n=1 Tax=Bizionia myxarmorum TaxID=291186 RepID=A0A5D0QV53_9FLAO|nr:TlpA disulfide reductase family protein [Bizionia myxarmorum]TYB73002.1 TlpA family protein disulfide reductase [Bizionia myxarmorum]
MKTILKNIFNASIILIIYLILLAFITSDHKWLMLIMQIFIVVLFIIYKKSKSEKKFFISILTFIVIIAFGMVFEKDISRGGLYLLFLPIIYILTKKSYDKKWLIPIIPIIILFNSFVVFPNYFEWIKSFNSPDSIGTDISKLDLVDENGRKIVLPSEGYLVLDFWTTSCSQCFKKFPILDALSNKYQDDINFYAINVPTKKDKNLEQIVERIEREGYKFNKLYATNQKETQKLLNFNLYPQIFFIQDGKVINTELRLNNSLVYISNLEYEIQRLIK